MSTFYQWVFNENKDLNKTAFSTYTKKFTYSELQTSVDTYKKMLKNHGVKRGIRVALIIPSIAPYLSLFMAVNELGATVVPLSPQLREQDLLSVLELIEPHMVFTVEESQDIDFKSIIKKWSNQNGKQTSIFTSLDFSLWHSEVTNGETIKPESEQIDVIACSSGSTGTPKGIKINMVAWSYMLKRIQEGSHLSSKDKVFSITPPSSQYGLTWIFSCLMKGTHIVLSDRFDLFKAMQYLKSNPCNKIVSTPSVFKSLYLLFDKMDASILHRFEEAVFAGEVINPIFIDSLKEMKNCKFVGFYGMSETGMLMWNFDLTVLGWEIATEVDFQLLPDNEMRFRTPSSFSGYYKQPRLTEDVLKDGWVYTGDLGTLHENGRIDFIGRKKDMIKKGGQQIIPKEIEQILMQHPKVKEAVIVGVPHEVYGEKVVAFITGDSSIHIQDLFDLCQRRIAKYKTPDDIYQIKEIPVNQGKADKLTLRKMLVQKEGKQ